MTVRRSDSCTVRERACVSVVVVVVVRKIKGESCRGRERGETDLVDQTPVNSSDNSVVPTAVESRLWSSGTPLERAPDGRVDTAQSECASQRESIWKGGRGGRVPSVE